MQDKKDTLDQNMLFSDEEPDRKTKFLLTKSKANENGDDYFVNIETAYEPFEASKTQNLPPKSLKQESLIESAPPEQIKEEPNVLRKAIGVPETLRNSTSNLKTISVGMLHMNLKTIDLSYNKIRSLPDEITQLLSLQELRLDHNLLHRLPAQFWRLKTLKELNLSRNRITHLPENIHWLQSLEVLKLDYNKLTVVPEHIGVLINLKKLYLHENSIAHLPRELCNLTNLIEFSTEWFLYTKPSNAKIQKNNEVIKSIREFCQKFYFADPIITETRDKQLVPALPIQKVYKPFVIPKGDGAYNDEDQQDN